MTSAVWQSWDGAHLRWRVDPAVAGSDCVELWLDDVLFERRPMTEFGQREFTLAPAGQTRMAFSLRTAGDVMLAPTWRVHYGEPAVPGHDAWHGNPASLAPLAEVPLPLPRVLTRAPGVSIIVPVHNSAGLVHACVESIRRWTKDSTHLILIDDASEDAEIAALLGGYASLPNVTVLHNAENRGYTYSCNRAIEAAGSDDVLLLNADTEVGPRWLHRLRQIAYSDESIGSVTAVSDNAGAFSVPELETCCPIPSSWTLTQTQRALLQHCGGCLPELPSGNGFCMYIKRELLDRVGLLDVEAFPQGYGEENDLCQRAERVGFRHVIAGDVFVRHVRSASFGEARRTALGVQGMEILRTRYPDYEEKVGATLYSFARRVLDYRVRRVYAQADSRHNGRLPRPRVLIVVGDRARGIALSAAVRDEYQAWFLEANENGMHLSDDEDGSRSAHLETSDTTEVLEVMRRWLVSHAIELIHLDLALPVLREMAQELDIPVLDATGESHDLRGADQVKQEAAAVRCAATDLTSRYRQAMREGVNSG